jgi:hypothetical protein
MSALSSHCSLKAISCNTAWTEPGRPREFTEHVAVDWRLTADPWIECGINGSAFRGANSLVRRHGPHMSALSPGAWHCDLCKASRIPRIVCDAGSNPDWGGCGCTATEAYSPTAEGACQGDVALNHC